MTKSILIDATHFAVAQPTGVENYTNNLLPALSKELLKYEWEVSWISHLREKPGQAGLEVPEGVRWIYSRHKPYWSQLVLPWQLKKSKASVYFTPSGIAPLLYFGKSVMTVHDLSVYFLPEAYGFGQTVRLLFLSKMAAKRSRLILTPSLYTASLINKIWHYPKEKITVTPLGYKKIKGDKAPVAGVEADPLLLYLGRIEAKKNLLPVIEGFRKVAGTNACQLVLAGPKGQGAHEIEVLIAKMPEEIRSRIIVPGYISEEQKNWLYGKALAVLVPGKGEGFGIPVLEAFANEVPAICAQAGSLVEVGQNAVLFAQPDSPTDWSIQMKILMDNPRQRSLCVERGLALLEDYSWEKTAKLSAEAINSLC